MPYIMPKRQEKIALKYTKVEEMKLLTDRYIFMKKQFNGCTIELKKGDISQQTNIEAIVNAANAQLKMGGGVAGAIHRKAGPELEEECRELAPIKPGEAVITKAYQLPNQFVIHCLGPIYGHDKPENVLLEKCYLNALKLADKKNISSIAFPSLSTGAFGYPIEEAAKIALKAITKKASSLQHVRHIFLILYSEEDLNVYQQVLQKIKT